MQIRFPKILLSLICVYCAATLTSMAAMSITAGLLCMGVFAILGPKKFLEEFNFLLKTPLGKGLALGALGLFFVAVVSLIFAEYFPLTYGENTLNPEFLRPLSKFWYFLLPFFVAIALKNIENDGQKRVFQTWMICFGILSIVGFLQYFTGWPREQRIPTNVERFHVILFLGHHLTLASVWIFPLFFALSLLKDHEQLWKHKLTRVFLISAAIFGVATLYLTYSRMLWASLTVVLLIWIFTFLKKKIAIIAVCLFTLLSVILVMKGNLVQHFTSSYGWWLRNEIWEANFDFIKKRFLTGVGFKQNQALSGYYLLKAREVPSVFSGHAHNNFIEMLAGTGIFGLLLWIYWNALIIIYSFKSTVTKGLQKTFGRAMLFALVVFHLNGLTQVNFWDAKVMHSFFFCIGILLFFSSQQFYSESSIVSKST